VAEGFVVASAGLEAVAVPQPLRNRL
jgi:hypothetical protein